MTEQSLGKESDFLASSQSAIRTDSDSAKTKKKKSKGISDGADSKTSLQRKFESSPWYKERKLWIDNIRRHRKDLRSAKPIVDDKPPKLNVFYIYDVEILKGIQNSLTQQFNLNILMTKDLHNVNVGGGKTSTFEPQKGKPVVSNFKFRREEAKIIEKQNKIFKEVLQKTKPRLPTVKQFAEQWEKTLSIIENSAQFPLFWKVEEKEAEKEVPPPPFQVKQFVTEKSAKYPDKRPRVFLEISIKNVGVVGKMVAVLYSDYVPMTVKNFMAFIDPKAELTYKGNLFYLIFPNFYCQTGDVVENKGYGGTSIYGPYFGNEDLTLRHEERGNLTMFSKSPNRNASQFLITFRKLESLDGQNVVFGKIIRGGHVLDAIEGVGSMKSGRPKVEMYISDCDEI